MTALFLNQLCSPSDYAYVLTIPTELMFCHAYTAILCFGFLIVSFNCEPPNHKCKKDGHIN